MYGVTFDLESKKSNDKILELNSPRNNVGGPYVVVFKNIDERWAIVAMDWNKQPRLGIRWFGGNGGTPFSSSHPIWLVIPPNLSRNILLGLPINHSFSAKIDDYLSEKIQGTELKKTQKKEQ